MRHMLLCTAMLRERALPLEFCVKRFLISVLATTAVAPSLLSAQASSPTEQAPAERYESLSSDGYYAGLVELWREYPESPIPVIDRDLEQSLAFWEEEGEAKRAEIDALIARALVGARAATEATGRRRVLDYVTSFAGWDAEQKATFRAGQQAFRSGREALGDGDEQTALEQGRLCRSLAEPLGDWWGTAMGLQLEGRALAALGDRDEATTVLARARLLYRELGLTSSAVRLEADLAELLLASGSAPRAEAMIEDGLASARRLGMDDVVARFEELRRGR